MNPLDWYVLSFLNQFAHHSWTFDYFVVLLSKNYVIKTGPIIVALVWLWYRHGDDQVSTRTKLLCGILASCAAVLVARIISLVAPFRERPLRSGGIDFVLPYGIDPQAIFGWSAFPSDNATLYFGLAACLYLISPRAGLAGFGHIALVVGFARVYLGYHHPTDIMAGALLGIGAVALTGLPRLRATVTEPLLRWMSHHPPSFHAAFFMMIFLMATTFEPLYPLAGFVVVTTKAAMKVASFSALTAAVHH